MVLMMLMFFFLMFIFCSFFNKKLVVLLSIEGMMLVSIMLSQLNFFNSYMSIFILISLSMFMVLDSVLGVSILIASSRDGQDSCKIF